MPAGHTNKKVIPDRPLTALFGGIPHHALSQSGKNVMRSLRDRGLVECDETGTIYQLAK